VKKILIFGVVIAALMIGMILPGAVGAANVAAECCPPCDDECPSGVAAKCPAPCEVECPPSVAAKCPAPCEVKCPPSVAAKCPAPCEVKCPPTCPSSPCCECTRTPGFWKTHLAFTDHVFGGSIDLGWKQCDSIEDVMGMLWANKAKDCDGSKRDKLNKARVICSYQALAAHLNSGLCNGAPLPLSWCTIKTILSGDDICDIQALYETLSAYNESGDECEIVCCPCCPDYNPATPQAAKSIAYIGIADP
jgi:hypothetical protein